METKALERPSSTRALPSILGDGWLDRFFNTPLDEYFSLSKVVSVPSVNISETDQEFIVCLATPGMERKDFKVESTEDSLTISAEKEKVEKMIPVFKYMFRRISKHHINHTYYIK
mgnify:CR=1 FL=1